MTYFLKKGNTFNLVDNAALDIHDTLPVGNYTVKITPEGQMYLEIIDAFTMPSKLYGDAISMTDRILSTFNSRPNSTGIMLTGEKGSGKTLLAKNLSIQGAKAGIPTVVINAPWRGDGFNTFIQSIDQEAIILFDEFEKVYDHEQQEEILTLLDGVYPSKKLFILTCNDKYRVDRHMRNRPGRIFYMIDYKGLDVNFIREYCEDNLKNKQHIDSIANISTIFDAFNFDMLKALVEEMNRYNETPQEALRMLNVKQEFDEGGAFDCVVKDTNTNTDIKTFGFTGNPLRPSGIETDYDPDPEDDESEWFYIHWYPNDLTNINAAEGIFSFKNREGKTLTMTRRKVTTAFDYNAF